MRPTLVTALALAACQFQANGTLDGSMGGSGDARRPADGAGDSGSGSATGGDGSNGSSGSACYGDTIVMVCFGSNNLPGSDRTLPTKIDTTKDCDLMPGQSDGSTLCVVDGVNIDVSSAVAVTGANPLAIVATGYIHVNSGAALDVRAANDFGQCPAFARTPGTDGGGAGGSFQGAGGAGGNGFAAGASSAGGSAGSAIAATAIATLRGGCIGQDGGSTNHSGGDGGGALALIAGSDIEIATIVEASGLGGAGGSKDSTKAGGGGGGGAGGMILLDSTNIHVDGGGQVFVNGGGGAEGGDGSNPGRDGQDGTVTVTAGGTGEDGNGNGGGGGNGAGGSGTNSVNGASGGGNSNGNGGGGGGGGGVGFIVVFKSSSILNGGSASPTPTIE